MRSGWQKSRSSSWPQTNELRKRFFSRSGKFVTNKQVMDGLMGLVKEVKEVREENKKIKLSMDKIQSKIVNVGLLDFNVNMFLAEKEDQEGDWMIVDSGAPCSLVGRDWLKRYIRKMVWI